MTTSTEYAVFAHGTFWGVFSGADADTACQMAADEHGTIDVGQNRASIEGLYALPARESILSAQRNAAENDHDLRDTIRECFNCHEADIDADGDVWIADPQTGHWLRGDQMATLIAFINR